VFPETSFDVRVGRRLAGTTRCAAADALPLGIYRFAGEGSGEGWRRKSERASLIATVLPS
jgi:hypothetical protein